MQLPKKLNQQQKNRFNLFKDFIKMSMVDW